MAVWHARQNRKAFRARFQQLPGSRRSRTPAQNSRRSDQEKQRQITELTKANAALQAEIAKRQRAEVPLRAEVA